MTIAFSNLGASANPDINSGVNATSYANTSWTPPTTGLILCFVQARAADFVVGDTPTMSGNSLTWVQIGSTYDETGPAQMGGNGISLFAADANGAITGVTTIDFSGETQAHCTASFFQATGADISGGVAAAFVQNQQNKGTGTNGSITLNAAGNSDNRPVSCFHHVIEESVTPRTNWTELDEFQGTGQVRGTDTQYRDDQFETTASASWSTSAGWGGFAVELKASAAGPITVDTGNITVATPVANASSPQQFSHTCGADVDALVVVVTIFDTSADDGVVSGVKYNGVSFDSPAATLYYDSLSDGHCSVWLLPSPITGDSYTVEVSFGGVVTDFEAAAIGIESAVGTFAKDSNGTPATGTSGDLSISWDTIETDTIVFSASLDDQTDVGKVHPQEIEIYNVDVGDVVSAQYAIRTGSGSQSMVVVDDDGDEDWVIVGAAFKEITAANQYYQSTDGVLTPVGTIIKSGGKVLAGVLTPVGIISKITSKTFTGSSTLVGTLIKQAQKLLAGATTPVGTLATSLLRMLSIAGSLTPSGTIVKQTRKNIAGSLTASGVLIKSTIKSFTGSLTAAGTLIKQTGKILLGSLTMTGVLTIIKSFTKSISGTLTLSGILIKQTSKSFVGSVTAVGTLLRATARSLVSTGSLTPVGSLVKQAGKGLLGSLTASGILATAKTVFESITGSLTLSGLLTRQTGKIVLGSLTVSGTLIKQAGKVVSGSVIATGSLVKRTAKSFIGSITAAGSLATQKFAGGYFQVVGGVLTMSGIVVKKTSKIFVGSLTAAGALVKQTRKVLLGSITSSGVLTTAKTFLLSIGGSLTLVGTLIRQTNKILIGNLTPVGTLVRRTAKAFIGSITTVGSLVKQAAISLVGSVTAVGSLATQKIVSGYFQDVGGVLTMSGIVTRQTYKIFTGSLTAAGTLIKHTSKIFVGSLILVGTLAKQTIKSYIGSITAVGSLVTQKSLFQVIDGVLTMSGILVRQTNKRTAGIVTMTGSITKRISKSISGVLTAVGVLVRQLLGLPTPYDQIFAISSENRIYAIAKEVRIYSIPG